MNKFPLYCLFHLILMQSVYSLQSVRIPILDRDFQEIGYYDKSKALIIGNTQYKHWPDLPGVEEEVRLVEESLRSHGFEVQVATNLNYEEMNETMRRFVVKNGSLENTRLVFYFAGHGDSLESRYGGDPMGYLVATDTPDSKNRQEFKLKSLSMDRIQAFARQIESRHALFVFDSCYSGTVLFSMTRSIPRYISQKTSQPVRMFITAGQDDQEVPDQSLFSRVFVDGLSGEADTSGDGYITGLELGEFIHNRVVDITNRSQTPMYGRLRDRVLSKGDFVFLSPLSESSGNPLQDLKSMKTLAESLLVEAVLEKSPSKLERVEKILDAMKAQKAGKTLTYEVEKKFKLAKSRFGEKPVQNLKTDGFSILSEPKWVYVYTKNGKYLGNTKDQGYLMVTQKVEPGTSLIFKKRGFEDFEMTLDSEMPELIRVNLHSRNQAMGTLAKQGDTGNLDISKIAKTQNHPLYDSESRNSDLINETSLVTNRQVLTNDNSPSFLESQKFLGIEFLKIPAGHYVLDSQIYVLDHPIWMSQREVSEVEWARASMRPVSKEGKSVSDLTLLQVQTLFFDRMNQGRDCVSQACYRLPREKEWWLARTSGGQSNAPQGEKNYWGFEQMGSSLWEWTQEGRVVDGPFDTWDALRRYNYFAKKGSAYKHPRLGFRIVLDSPPAKAQNPLYSTNRSSTNFKFLLQDWSSTFGQSSGSNFVNPPAQENLLAPASFSQGRVEGAPGGSPKSGRGQSRDGGSRKSGFVGFQSSEMRHGGGSRGNHGGFHGAPPMHGGGGPGGRGGRGGGRR